MCVCLTKMWTEDRQDHPVQEVKHEGELDNLKTELFYSWFIGFSGPSIYIL